MINIITLRYSPILFALSIGAMNCGEQPPEQAQVKSIRCKENSPHPHKYVWEVGGCNERQQPQSTSICETLSRDLYASGYMMMGRQDATYTGEDVRAAFDCALSEDKSLFFHYQTSVPHHAVDLTWLFKVSDKPWPGEAECKNIEHHKPWYECFRGIESHFY